jgi:hypothetical protein
LRSSRCGPGKNSERKSMAFSAIFACLAVLGHAYVVVMDVVVEVVVRKPDFPALPSNSPENPSETFE